MSVPAAAAMVVVRPAPRREPPFDDERSGAQLRLVGEHDRPLPFAPPAVARPLSLVQNRSPLPDPARWTRRLLTGIFECAAGRRPMQQLSAMLTPAVAHGLGADFERAANARSRHWSSVARVCSARACTLADGVAEVSLTIAVGDRRRAVAVRVEEHRGRWRCTKLQLG